MKFLRGCRQKQKGANRIKIEEVNKWYSNSNERKRQKESGGKREKC